MLSEFVTLYNFNILVQICRSISVGPAFIVPDSTILTQKYRLVLLYVNLYVNPRTERCHGARICNSVQHQHKSTGTIFIRGISQRSGRPQLKCTAFHAELN